MDKITHENFFSSDEKIDAQFDRLLIAYGIEKKRGCLTAIAGKVKRAANVITGWKARGIPDEIFANASIDTGYSKEWLVNGSGPEKVRERHSPYGSTASLEGFVLIPRYNVDASAGGGAVVSEEQVVDRLAFKEDWVRHALGVKPADLALITTIGDSMEPTLHPGDVIMLDVSVTDIQNNALYALQVNGSLLVKRVQRMMDGRVIMRSDNDMYESETLDSNMADSIKVVGRVVWAGRKF